MDGSLLIAFVPVGVGLVGIAVALYFGLRSTSNKLERIEANTKHISKIREVIDRMDERTSRIWDVISGRFTSTESTTVERKMANLGNVKVTAQPWPSETEYRVEVEKPILREGFIAKKSKETDLAETEKRMFNREVSIRALSMNIAIIHVPSTDARTCTSYINTFLRWLDSAYFDALSEIGEFENHILSD